MNAAGKKLADYTFTNDSKGNRTKKVTTAYNSNGKKTSTETITYSNGKMTKSEKVDAATNNKTVCEYNANGKVTKQTNYGNGQVSSTTSFAYDSKNRLTTETKSDRGGQTVKAYTYDNAGKVAARTTSLNGVKQKEEHFKNGNLDYYYEWSNFQDGKAMKAVKCNAAGKKLADYSFTYDTKGNRTQKVTNTYNAKGQKTQAYTYNYSNGKEVLAAREKYEYDSKGNKIKKHEYDVEDGSLLRTTSYKYDNHNSLINTSVTYEAKSATTAGETLPNGDKITYTKNNGVTISAHRVGTNGDVIDYTYKNGKKSSALKTSKNGNKTVYTYGANEKITSAQTNCKNGDIINYAYTNGKKSSAVKKCPNGEEVTYKYDANEKVSSAKKVDYNGHTTNYTYSYKYKDGKVVSQTTTVGDKKSAHINYVKEYDASGRTTKDSVVFVRADGSYSVKAKSYKYESGKTSTVETFTSKDKKGKTLYQAKIENNESKLTCISDEYKAYLKQVLNEKIDLVAFDSSGVDWLVNFWEETTDYNYEKATIGSLRSEVNEAIQSGGISEIEKMYNKINGYIKVEETPDLLSELQSYEESKQFYNEVQKTKGDTIGRTANIRNKFNPAKDEPESVAECLLVQLDLIEKQGKLDYENSGCITKFTMFANKVLDFGTSKDDFKKTIAKYKREVYNLSDIKNPDQFIASYKALTGCDFNFDSCTELMQTGYEIYMCNNMDCNSSEGKKKLENAAKASGINLREAYNSEGKIDYGKLRTLYAGAIVQDCGAAKSSPGGTLKDYMETADSQTKLLIDVARTSAVALSVATFGAGAPVIVGAVVGGLVQGGLTAINDTTSIAAKADPEAMMDDICYNTISGGISGAFQGAAGDFAKDLVGKVNLSGKYAKIFADALNKIGIQGVGQNTIKEGLNYVMNHMDEFSRLNPSSKNALSQAEANKLLDGLCEALGDGAKNGLIAGGFTFVLGQVLPDDKIRTYLKNKNFNLGDGVTQKGFTGALLKTMYSLPLSMTSAAGKTVKDICTQFCQQKDISEEWIMETSIKDLTKAMLP